MNQLLNKLQGDKVIWMLTVLLSIISILAVYSSISTLAYKADGNWFKFLFKHTLMLGLGFVLMFVVHKIKFKYFSRVSQVMIWVAGGMLLFTLLFGVDINDAKRWIRIPFIGMTFQTSDFAKIVLIVYVARLLNLKRTVLHDFKSGVLPVLYPIIAICVLILPADFSTAAMLGLICFIMMFIAGVPFKHLIKIVGVAIAGIGLIYLVGKTTPELLPRAGTWAARIDSFFNPTEGNNYQIDLAQYAISDGGLLPHGPGTGSSRNFLPHPYSDMIFAFIVQEYGSILGAFGLIMLYIILLYRSIRISIKCPKNFGSNVVIGLSLMLTIQAFINMAVAVNLFPTTGQPLPLVSMGGTSTLFTCLALGIILAVSRSVFNPEEVKKDNKVRRGNSGANTLKEDDYAIA